MPKAIFIDMDDTLLATTALYEVAKDRFKAYMAPYGVTREELESVYNQAERDNFKIHGYSRARFPASFENTLKHFIPGATPEMIAEVRGFGEQVFETEAALLPGTEEAVKLLTENYPVYLVTQGDRSVQTPRIAQLPFCDKLSGIFIIEEKSQETFEKIAAQLGYAPADVVMIGDSLKSDIKPAIAAGLQAIWVEHHNWKMMENASHTAPPEAKRFPTLLDAARDLTGGHLPSAPKNGPSCHSGGRPR
jgi:putative hydrolase of the HAD superfamily